VALSAAYRSNSVILEWVVPKDAYDSISVIYGGIPLAALPGTASRYEYHGQFGTANLFNSSDVTFLIEGDRGGTPSNGTATRLRDHVLQESLMNIPFTQGVAPSFEAWTQSEGNGSLSPEQGELPGMAPATEPRQFASKGFYQVLRGHGTFRGGVYRVFLGLAAEHSYRASARMNTLQAREGAWSWSFHAASNPPKRNSLTPEQMSGMAELPDHTQGPTAGQIARYDYAKSTKGQWVLRSSETAGPGKSVGDVTVPEGCDSLTLWFRLEGTNVADLAVGVDSVALEDLGKR
jgi:hypothetical protein